MVKLGRNHPLVQLTTNSVCCRPSPVIVRNNVSYQFKATNFISGGPSEFSKIIGTTNYDKPFFLLITINDPINGIINLFDSNDGYLVPSSSPTNGTWVSTITNDNTINSLITDVPSLLYIYYYSSINGQPGIKLNNIQDIFTLPPPSP